MSGCNFTPQRIIYIAKINCSVADIMCGIASIGIQKISVDGVLKKTA